ncbi:MAG TPA: bifunctional phosphopantothenoylcysteine decarboxylase/phosphopantothenate--cysteine ligase CoaBC [Gammaproteobacteria bacterium]
MSTLVNKRILLGVTGGIAAYKSADLVRRLKEAGADVQVVMTASASEFVTPLTFQALSGRAVRTGLFDPAAEAAMGHIELARWADAVLIAPCSANTLSKLAQGIADNLLTTLCLASDAPLAVAPAMNRLMWTNPATRHNIELLLQRGVRIFGPATGAQACGELGEGRMLEPIELVKLTTGFFRHNALAGRQILITAGPTCESIDPVRFISNRSSGKMGFALAAAAGEAGASVTVVSGPVHLPTPDNVRRLDVETALQMHETVMRHVQDADIFIGCAAVGDYRVARPLDEKLKKTADELQLTLVRNPDILADVAALPSSPFTVGFAAETRDLSDYAQQKLKQKGVHMIAANLVGASRGFDSEDNALEVHWPGDRVTLPLMPKTKLARRLIALIAERYSEFVSSESKSAINEKETPTENS